ncbi:ABC transporter permease [Pseudonocardia sp. TRM90224]|uniref:ABC transporter permease n=1 Tax=Pseudonocardia sp. TRM90224 TaxID=2812678 RepID=UPI001E43ABCD|nr:ABC transporter permease [Pseudonocardia sp. TRM90224]
MTTATPATAVPGNPVIALAAAETKLILRNKTVAVSSMILPVALGIFWAITFDSGGDPARQAVVVALQLAVVLGMGIYVTGTQTLVARRHSRVLKRMRTTGLTDRGLLTATIAPSVVLGVAQLVIFAVINAVTGAPLPLDPLALIVAVVGGVALAVTAALATSIVTPTPERSQITTLPLTFVLLGAAIAMAVIPLDGWWHALVVVPGAAMGTLVQIAMNGDMWVAGPGGLPAGLPSLVATVAWPIVFAVLASRNFKWDPRH